jgi:hypothetical protein
MENRTVTGRFLLTALPEQKNKRHPDMLFIAHAGSHKALTVLCM